MLQGRRKGTWIVQAVGVELVHGVMAQQPRMFGRDGMVR